MAANTESEDEWSSDDTGIESSDSSDDEIELTTPPTWSNHTQGLRNLPFLGENKLLVDIPGNNRPIDWFLLLLDDVFLEMICRQTNLYAIQLFCKPATSEQSRITRWKELEVSELKVFIALLLHMGTITLNRLQDYWKGHWLFNLPCFRAHMSRDRFLLIMRCLYFSKVYSEGQPPSTNRLEKIADVVDYVNNKMFNIYYPSRELVIDESMVLWRGRLSFRQYLPAKRHKYGIKVYSLNEPEGLTVRIRIYSGANDQLLSGKGHAHKVVMALLGPANILNKGHAIYLDNFYNSVSLASKLLSNDTYCTGTLRENRKYNPEVVVRAQIPKGSTIAQYAEGMMVGLWKDKKKVIYISTEFENKMVTAINKRNEEKTKPLPIVQYNAHMKGVDRADQLLSYYPCERKTIRWYKKMFIHVLQVLLINSFYLYNMHNVIQGKSKMTLYDFRLAVLEQMLLATRDLAQQRTPPARPRLPGNEHRLVKNEDRDKNGGTIRKKCRVCYRPGNTKRSTFVCRDCPDKPGLCPVDCHQQYHANMNN